MRFLQMIPMLVSGILTITAGATLAQAPQAVPAGTVGVEEVWQLVIDTPDPDGVGPQITTCMSPVSDDSTPFVAFNMNYREFPVFQSGGMQLQVWSGKKDPERTSSQGDALLNTPGETITWTQRMDVSNGTVTYQILPGAQSTTWGDFGQLNVSFSAPVDTMTDYSPDKSVSKSGVGWEKNRVTSMTLLQVTYYDANGQKISTDANPRPVNLN